MLASKAARQLGISPRTLWGYAASGVIDTRRDQYGRRVYTEEDLAIVRECMAQRARAPRVSMETRVEEALKRREAACST